MEIPHWLQYVHHDGSMVSALLPQFGERVGVRIQTPAGAPIEQLYLRTFPDGEQHFAPLQRGETIGKLQWWHGELPIDEPRVHYRFVLQASDGVWWYTAKGIQIQEPLDIFDFSIVAGYQPPTWLHDAVFYQIFIDRFANGDPANDPQPHHYEVRGQRPQTYAWDEPPDDDQSFHLVFYGGDLDGIVDHLDHLERLGVNAVYLNPIFTADSNHKYDVADYEQVDIHFGGDAALARLRTALSARNMRYILDIMPNHCGYSHHWFQKARQNRHCPEAGYFTFFDHPDQYATWLGVWSLPKLNYRSAALRARMYEDSDSIFRRWLRPPYAADGWRVDVANMLARQKATQLGIEITKGIRQAVKHESNDNYLLGENFFDATDQLQGDQYDGVMNYAGFTHPLLHWLAGYRLRAWGLGHEIESSAVYSTLSLVTTLQERLAVIPWQIALQQFNLLGSHDTARVRSLVNNNDRLHRLAVAVQLTYPGIPCIYYGDEIGMVDDDKLAQRGAMVWQQERWDHELLRFYQELIALRRRSAALQQGGLRFIGHGDDWFAYLRAYNDEQILVVASRSAAPIDINLDLSQIAFPNTIYTEPISGTQHILTPYGRLFLSHFPQGALIASNAG